MRHQRVQKKFGRSMEHRKALMKSLVTNLILAESIQTTLPKAKQARKDAERIVTVARKGGLAARRLAASRLQQPKAVQKLFDKIVPQMEGRNGGYTRIVKTGTRGVTISRLAPTGKALIDGEQMEVHAVNKFIDPDRPIEVVDIEGYRIDVREVDDTRFGN